MPIVVVKVNGKYLKAKIHVYRRHFMVFLDLLLAGAEDDNGATQLQEIIQAEFGIPFDPTGMKFDLEPTVVPQDWVTKKVQNVDATFVHILERSTLD